MAAIDGRMRHKDADILYVEDGGKSERQERMAKDRVRRERKELEKVKKELPEKIKIQQQTLDKLKATAANQGNVESAGPYGGGGLGFRDEHGS